MSRTKHRQSTGAQQWNPPPIRPGQNTLMDENDVQSATECTGLMQRVPGHEDDAQALSDLYQITQVKPQGNVGKDNPRNNPEEIAFHRQ